MSRAQRAGTRARVRRLTESRELYLTARARKVSPERRFSGERGPPATAAVGGDRGRRLAAAYRHRARKCIITLSCARARARGRPHYDTPYLYL